MMKRRRGFIIVLIFGFAMVYLSPCVTSADDDEREHRKRNSRDGSRERGFNDDNGEHEYRNRDSSPIDNPTYKEQCGACHFAYPPELLPSGSWREILSHLENHNGEEVEIEATTREALLQYLEANSAERSASKRPKKILKSLNGQTPTRVTDVPYIRSKHHEISSEVFKRESIGSFSNCVACHTTAEQGIFDDDNVKIPN